MPLKGCSKAPSGESWACGKVLYLLSLLPLPSQSTIYLWRCWVLIGGMEHRNQMVLTHTWESAGVLRNIKVNGQNRAAELSGILLTWHVILVNWTFQLTDGYLCSCPLLTQVLLLWNSLHFFPYLLSLLSLSCWQIPFFLSWCCLFFSSFSFCFFFYLATFLFFLYPEASGLGFCWPAYITFDYSLSSLNLVFFLSFNSTQLCL